MVDATDFGKTKIIASLIRDFIIYVEQNCFDERKAFEAFCDIAVPHLKKYNKQLLVNRDYIINVRQVLARENKLNMNIKRLRQINTRFTVSEFSSMEELISAFLKRGDVLYITQDHESAAQAMIHRAVQTSNVYTKFITQEINLQSFSDLKTKYGNLGNTIQDAAKVPHIIFDLSSLCYENSHWFIDDLCSQSLTNFKVLVLKSQLDSFEKECLHCRYAETIYSKLERESVICSRTDLENRDDEATIRKLRTESNVGVLTFQGDRASQFFNMNNKDLSGHNVLPFKLTDGDVDSTYETPWQRDIQALKERIVAKLNETVDTYKKYEKIAQEKKNEEIATEQKNNNVSNDLAKASVVTDNSEKPTSLANIKGKMETIDISTNSSDSETIAVDILTEPDIIDPGIAAPHIQVNENHVIGLTPNSSVANVANADLNNDQFTNPGVVLNKEGEELFESFKSTKSSSDTIEIVEKTSPMPAKTVSLFGNKPETKDKPIEAEPTLTSLTSEAPVQKEEATNKKNKKKEKKSIFKSLFGKKEEEETPVATNQVVAEVSMVEEPEVNEASPEEEKVVHEPQHVALKGTVVGSFDLTPQQKEEFERKRAEEAAEKARLEAEALAAQQPDEREPQHVALKGSVAGSFDLTPQQKEEFEKKRAEEAAEKARLEEEARIAEEARLKAEAEAKRLAEEEAKRLAIIEKARDEAEAKAILEAKEREEALRKEREEEKKKHVPKAVVLQGNTVASGFTLTPKQREDLEKKRAEEAAEKARLEAEKKAKEEAEQIAKAKEINALEDNAVVASAPEETTIQPVEQELEEAPIAKEEVKLAEDKATVAHPESSQPEAIAKEVASEEKKVPQAEPNVKLEIVGSLVANEEAKAVPKSKVEDRLAVKTEVPAIEDAQAEISEENAKEEEAKRQPKAFALQGSSVASGFTLTPEQRARLEEKRAEEAAEKARLEAEKKAQEAQATQEKVKRDPMKVKLSNQASAFGMSEETKKKFEARHEINKQAKDEAQKAEEARRAKELHDLNVDINTIKAIEEYALEEKVGDFVFDEKSDVIKSDATPIEDFDMTPERRELLRKYETSQRAEVEVKRNLSNVNLYRTDDQKRTTARNVSAVESRKTSDILGFDPSSLSDAKHQVLQNKTNPERTSDDLKKVDDFIAANSIKHEGVITKPAVPMQNTRVRSSVTVEVVEKAKRSANDIENIEDLTSNLNIAPFEYTGEPYVASVDLGIVNIPSFEDSVQIDEETVPLNKPLVMSQSLAIFENTDDTNIKIFGHGTLNAALIAKLSTMIDNPVKLSGVDWPTKFVRNASGETVGCVVPKNTAKSLKKMLLGSAEYFALLNRIDLVKLAIDYVQKVMKLHKINVFLGDEDLNSVVVNADHTVTFINLDKMQIGDYLYSGNLEARTAPELNSENGLSANISSDNFVVASTLFKLLFLGRSPYVMNVKQGVAVNKLLAFRFPTNIFDAMTAPKDAALFIWSFFPQYVKQAFIDTLNYGYHDASYRTPAAEWLKILKKWLVELESTTVSPMALEITPSRMSIGDRNNMVTCRVCHAPVAKDDAVATDGYCHHCFNQRGKLTRCSCCGKDFLVSYRDLKLANEQEQKICPECKSKFLRIKTISKCKGCGKSYNITEGHVTMYKEEIYTFCPECIESEKNKDA